MCEEVEEGGGGAEAAAYALSAEAVGGGRPREHASGDVPTLVSGGPTICMRTAALLCLWYV